MKANNGKFEQKPLLNHALSQRQIELRRLLQMDAVEIEQYAANAALENPLLEWEKEERPRERREDWAARADRQNAAYEDEAFDPLLFVTDDHGVDLQTYLCAKADLMPGTVEEHTALRALIACLESNGRLGTPVEEIAERTGLDVTLLGQALHRLQRMDPVGMAARSLAECLELQLLAAAKPDPLALRLVREQLDTLGEAEPEQLARLLDADAADVRRAVQTVRGLDPFPCPTVERMTPIRYVREDLIALRTEEGFRIIPADDPLTALSLNREYPALLSAAATEEERRWLNARRREAEELIGQLTERRRVLVRCAEELIRRQPEYVQDRRAPLRPLTMAEVGRVLQMHATAVGRMVGGKYIRIGRELVEMRSFFSRQITPGQHITAGAVKAEITALMDARTEPLTDEMLCNQLRARGIRISRRTTAKYRREMGLPSSYGQKKAVKKRNKV